MVPVVIPGIEKGIARYPRLLSRIGLCHEIRAPSDTDTQVAAGTTMCSGRHETPYATSRTGGHRRSFSTNLRQLPPARSLVDSNATRTRDNGHETLSVDAVETARDNPVIGQA